MGFNKKTRLFFVNFGKLLLDAAKLCFGSLVLGTMLKGEIESSRILIIGVIVSVLGALLGLILISGNEE